jgi:hypothetical protein
MDFIKSFKPKMAKRYLLLLAALVWTFAGGLLLFKGLLLSGKIDRYLWARVLFSIIGGLLFYWLLFSKISLKHAKRIIKMKNDKPCLFSFFNIKSYILMAIMITSGILIRKSGLLSQGYLLIIYITMGIPLFLSAFRFYYYGIYYDRFINHQSE